MNEPNHTPGPLSRLPKILIDENGGNYGFVCIWRAGDHSNSAKTMTVGEFLLKPENQFGEWLIDGGWGAPPGAVRVVV